MAFRRVDGKLAKVDGKFSFRNVNTLTFEVYGSQFPETNYTALFLQNFLITFHSKQSLTINWGDGFSTQYSDISSFNVKSNGSTPIQPYIYQDGNTGSRLITFTFDSLLLVRGITIEFTKLTGTFPIELGESKTLEVINLRSTELNGFPDSLSNIGSLKTWITRQAIIGGLHSKIPDGIFNSNIEILIVSGTYDLSNNIASNFFKINQIKNSLIQFSADACKIKTLVEEIRQCIGITDLRINSNDFDEFPKQIESLTQLNWLSVGNLNFQVIDGSLIDFSNHSKLKRLLIFISNLNLFEIPIKWNGLFSLENMVEGFNIFINTNARFDEFITHFYTLCTQNGSITNNSGQFATYPNRFRNISWGHGTLSFTGAKVAPAGYVQGVSNGTPANEGEKVYVLQNQYGHLITHA